MTPKDVEWVPQARWVVDGKTWTNSGVTVRGVPRNWLTRRRGSDMEMAFVDHLVGAKVGRIIRGLVEIPEVTFAAFRGLV